jgi:hypothetical protein
MVYNRFSTHSSMESFHHLKQTASVSEYILKFEELMALMQMEHPGLTEQYFVSSFIARLKEGIKHYLIPHSPQSLCDTYWKAKELGKGILIKKSLLSSSCTYPKPTQHYNTLKYHTNNLPTQPPSQPTNQNHTTETQRAW